MIIDYRDPWRKTGKKDASDQLQTIGEKAEVYKDTLNIPDLVWQRIQKSSAQDKFLVKCENSVNSWLSGLYGLDKQLQGGDSKVMMLALEALPTLDTPPVSVNGGIEHYVDLQRGIWMKHDNFTDGIGEAMTILGPLKHLNSDDYTPEIEVYTIAGGIVIKTDSAIITDHNLLCGTFGVNPLPFITKFSGKKFTYTRIMGEGIKSENLGVQLQGVWKNATIGHLTAVVNISYKG